MSSRQRITVITVVLLAIAGAASIRVAAESRQAARAEAQQRAKVARGKYLVGFGGCHDCHTPWIMTPKGPGPDMSRALSGHPESMALGAAPKPQGGWTWAGAATNTAYAGPWGVSYAANLTPERLTGTGIWDETMFVKTIRTGRHWGVGRPILPPMPYQNLQNLTDDDLKAIFAYLRTLKPIKNQVPDAIVAAH
ncbi:MAG TPA: c-type cytochrome [Thermoanaerobaculia bacterium]|nr:c-type cytochrome [Thermoanaerobaculia bacterium]